MIIARLSSPPLENESAMSDRQRNFPIRFQLRASRTMLGNIVVDNKNAEREG